jgi:ABC-type branched-subunit amino acid transport system permease subunit
MSYYIYTLFFFFFVYFILAMGLNIQFGETGILNFAYIGFVAVGAYVTGATSLPARIQESARVSITFLGLVSRSRSTY